MKLLRNILVAPFAMFCPGEWGIIATALGVMWITTQGCKPQPQLEPATVMVDPVPALPPGPRRATAAELVEAADTGVIPDWFNQAERSAVRRIAE